MQEASHSVRQRGLARSRHTLKDHQLRYAESRDKAADILDAIIKMKLVCRIIAEAFAKLAQRNIAVELVLLRLLMPEFAVDHLEHIESGTRFRLFLRRLFLVFCPSSFDLAQFTYGIHYAYGESKNAEKHKNTKSQQQKHGLGVYERRFKILRQLSPVIEDEKAIAKSVANHQKKYPEYDQARDHAPCSFFHKLYSSQSGAMRKSA